MLPQSLQAASNYPEVVKVFANEETCHQCSSMVQRCVFILFDKTTEIYSTDEEANPGLTR